MIDDRLAVVLLTYAPSLESPRHAYAVRALDSLVYKVRYSGSLCWHIADDGSPQEHVETLNALRVMGKRWSVTNALQHGYGASFNLATQALHDDCDFLLMVEDDWELTRPLDLDPLVAALKDGLGCIRLGYLGWTQEMRGRLAKYGCQSFLALDPDSPEPHVWAGHPRLETREYQRRVGPWPEGLNPGATEFAVAVRREAREGVAWPLDLMATASQSHEGSLFRHIGAVQARSDQG